MVCLTPHWEQLDKCCTFFFGLALASFSTNSEIRLLSFWLSFASKLNQAPWQEECTEIYSWDDLCPLLKSLPAAATHTHTQKHTQHHEVASAAPCQAWTSSTLLNYQWAVNLTADSTGGTGPWELSEVFVMRSFQGNFRSAAVAFRTVCNPCSLRLKV